MGYHLIGSALSRQNTVVVVVVVPLDGWLALPAARLSLTAGWGIASFWAREEAAVAIRWDHRVKNSGGPGIVRQYEAGMRRRVQAQGATSAALVNEAHPRIRANCYQLSLACNTIV